MNKTAIMACAGLLMLGACSHKTMGDQTIQPSTAPGMVLGTPAAMLPKATLFKMSGNYADRVAVGYSNGQLTYYPAPTDISAASAPLEIGNGWWLNRQGLGQTSLHGGADVPEAEKAYFSCLPWMEIPAMSSERSLDPDDAIPRIMWGKYVTRDGRLELCVSADVNHRLIDGYHIGLFYQELQHAISSLPG